MARSSYVYVVLSGRYPVAGFTVRHELVTWLSSPRRRSNSDNNWYDVWRMPDGLRSDRLPKLVTKEIMELVNASN